MYLDGINFSLDGPSPDDHAFLRHSPSLYGQVMDGIDTAVEAGLEVKVWCVVNRRNAESCIRLGELLAQKRVSKLGYFYLSPIGHARPHTGELCLAPHEWLAFLNAVRAEAERLHPEILVVFSEGVAHLSDPDLLVKSSFCMAQERQVCHVHPRGDVHFCPFLFEQGLRLGSLTEAPLSDIWTSETAWTRCRDGVHGALQGCAACSKGTRCGGGCQAFAGNQLVCSSNQSPGMGWDRVVPLCPHLHQLPMEVLEAKRNSRRPVANL